MKKDVTTYSIFILLLFLSTNKVFASINIVDNFNSSSIELHLKDTGHKKVNNILDHPERLKIECDDQKMARACFAYATYLYVEPELYKQSYDYFVTAYNLGQKESGVYIANYQINHPEIFTNDIQLSIDESIYYAEQAFESGFPDATRLLMVIYTKPEFKRVDYKKAEYYSKIAIEQNVKFSRIYLASLYMYEMKNEAKIKESIKLYQDDLMIEKNWQSALALMTIHLYPEEYGATFEP
ncbi:hypothetical protein, partial [Psychrobacter celer]